MHEVQKTENMQGFTLQKEGKVEHCLCLEKLWLVEVRRLFGLNILLDRWFSTW
jgi:hypothetical protein